jgi:hypothetical protein
LGKNSPTEQLADKERPTDKSSMGQVTDGQQAQLPFAHFTKQAKCQANTFVQAGDNSLLSED